MFAQVLGYPAWEPLSTTRPDVEIYATTHCRVGQFRNALQPPDQVYSLAREVVFGIVADESINAVAFRSPGPTIAFNSGTLATLRVVAYNALANPQCYPEFEPEREDRSRARVADQEEVGAAFRTAAYIAGPLSPLRKFLAGLLFADGVGFLYAHELGHLCRKHLEFQSSTHSLAEQRASAGGTAVPYVHEIELDADRFATLMSLNGHVRPAQATAEERFRIRMWFTAVTLLFFVFDDPQLPWDDHGSTHPHPLIRWWLLLFFAAELFPERRRDDLMAAHRDSMKDLGIILQVVGLPQHRLLLDVLLDTERCWVEVKRAYFELAAFRQMLHDT
jgi:hypothetical protein